MTFIPQEERHSSTLPSCLTFSFFAVNWNDILENMVVEKIEAAQKEEEERLQQRERKLKKKVKKIKLTIKESYKNSSVLVKKTKKT